MPGGSRRLQNGLQPISKRLKGVNCLSGKQCGAVGGEATTEVKHGLISSRLFPPAGEDAAKAVEPAVRACDHPAAGFLSWLLFRRAAGAPGSALAGQRGCSGWSLPAACSRCGGPRAPDRPMGAPPPSLTNNERLVPRLLRSTGLGPVPPPGQGSRLGDRPVRAHPGPVAASERVVLGRGPPARSAKRSRRLPTPGSGRAPWSLGRGPSPRARSTGSRFSRQRRCHPRTDDPARGAARHRSGGCSDAGPRAAPSRPKAHR